ncbi:MAG: serine/threonine protein kinase, partial [Planctomycetes bacterium]|nr:serine/threonine protein kinase [Planctomycetota bacterium]
MSGSEIPALEPGSTFAGKYRVERLVGQGGFGAVYEVRNELGWRQALKVLHPDIGGNELYRKRFLREMQIARDLLHENAVAVRDAGEVGGSLYYTMDFVEGATAAEEIKRHGRIDPNRAIDWAVQVLSFLEFLNNKGYLHRDLKPANIMIETDDAGRERVRVLDLGIARTLAADSPDAQTMLTGGMIIGTPIYMAPEHIAGDEVDQRIDYYALGVILYECVSGQKPFAGATVQRLYHAIHTETPSALPAILPGFSKDLWKVIQRAMAKDRDQRFPDARSFRIALDACRSKVGGAGDPDATIAETIAVPIRKAASRPKVLIAAAAAVVVLGLVAAIIWPRGDHDPGKSGDGFAAEWVGPNALEVVGKEAEIRLDLRGVAPFEVQLVRPERPVSTWMFQASDAVENHLFVRRLPIEAGSLGEEQLELTVTDARGESQKLTPKIRIDTRGPRLERPDPKSPIEVVGESLIVVSDEALASAAANEVAGTLSGDDPRRATFSWAALPSTDRIELRLTDRLGNESSFTLECQPRSDVDPGHDSPSGISTPPTLHIDSPREGAVIREASVQVQGYLTRESELSINGTSIPLKAIPLPLGVRQYRFDHRLELGELDGERFPIEFRVTGEPPLVRSITVDNRRPEIVDVVEERVGNRVRVTLVASESLSAATITVGVTRLPEKEVQLDDERITIDVAPGSNVLYEITDRAGNVRRDSRRLRTAAESVTTVVPTAPGSLPKGYVAVGEDMDETFRLPVRIRHEKSGIELVLVPPSPQPFSLAPISGVSEGDLERSVDAPFYLGVSEVTVGQLIATGFIAASERAQYLVDPNDCDESHPAVSIDWKASDR